MNFSSPGYRTQLIFTAFDGRAEDRGDHWALHSLSNPNFFWGNLLIFDRPPRRGDFKTWTEIFHKEFRDPAIYHITLERAGFGHWYGGYFENHLVAGLGIYHRNGLGRFQTVSTHPDFQRRGFCQSLVYLASQMAFSSAKINELVMCADPEYHAIKIYESVGFQRRVLEHGVYWWDKKRGPS